MTAKRDEMAKQNGKTKWQKKMAAIRARTTIGYFALAPFLPVI